MVTPAPLATTRDGLANILKNLAWLIGGKGFGAVCSLVYLAVLARSLGLKNFGHFSLIFGTGQALVAIAGFQTWQIMVRYGAEPVHQRDWARFGRLAWLGGTIDVAGAAVGCVLSFVVYYGFGGTLGLNPAYIDMAFAFSCALLLARTTTPNGIVRVLDRFDVGSYVEAVVPAGRLIASGVIAVIGATVGRFLFAWALFDLVAAALYWYAAWKLVPDALHRSQFGQWRQSLRENPGLGRFFGLAFMGSTLDAFYKQGPLLAVGYLFGTSAAGLYRLADQLAQGIGKLSGLITRAVFPEFAMARMNRQGRDFSRLVRQVTLMAAGAGVFVVAIALLLGKQVLWLMGGTEFVRGAPVLVPLALGAAFELAAVSYEPVLFSTGHAAYAVAVRALSVLTLGGAIFAFASSGPVGVGWAVALGLTLVYVAMSLIVRTVLRRIAKGDRA